MHTLVFSAFKLCWWPALGTSITHYIPRMVSLTQMYWALSPEQHYCIYCMGKILPCYVEILFLVQYSTCVILNIFWNANTVQIYFLQLVWLTSTDRAEHRVQYDSSMCVVSGGDAEAKRLMGKAFKETLSLPQQQHLLAQLDKDPRMVYHTGLTPPKVSCWWAFVTFICVSKFGSCVSFSTSLLFCVCMFLSMHIFQK